MIDISLRQNMISMTIREKGKDIGTEIHISGGHNSGKSIMPDEYLLCSKILHGEITTDTIFEDFFETLGVSDYTLLIGKSILDTEPTGYYDAEDEYYPPCDVTCIPLEKYPNIKMYSCIDLWTDPKSDCWNIRLQNPELIKIFSNTDSGKMFPVVWENVDDIHIAKENVL